MVEITQGIFQWRDFILSPCKLCGNYLRMEYRKPSIFWWQMAYTEEEMNMKKKPDSLSKRIRGSRC